VKHQTENKIQVKFKNYIRSFFILKSVANIQYFRK